MPQIGSSLATQVAILGLLEVGVKEHPTNSNRGTRVEQYLAAVSLAPGNPYCAAWISYLVQQASLPPSYPPTFKSSGGALRLLTKNPGLRMASPYVVPCVFVQDHGAGKGHCGLVLELLPDGGFVSIEANTGAGPAAPAADRDGGGVYRRQDRHVADCVGFIRIA